MLSEDQLNSLSELAESNVEVEILLHYYMDAQRDGVQATRLNLNSKLLALTKELEQKNCDSYFIYGQIMDVSKVLKKLPKPPKPEKEAKEKAEKTSSSKKKGHEQKVVV